MTEVPDWWLGPAGIVDLVTGADERIRARGDDPAQLGALTCHQREREQEVRRLTDPSSCQFDIPLFPDKFYSSHSLSRFQCKICS